MKFDTWQAIAKRHVWYRDLLKLRMAEWDDDRIAECTDSETLEAVIDLAERAEKHQVRMERHLSRGMVIANCPSVGIQ